MALKMNLLEMVQKILSRLGDDEVNSINDTIRSYDVASVVEDTYYEILLEDNLPEHWELIQLEALSDSTRPTLMKIPPNVSDIKNLRYNVRRVTDTRDRYSTLTYVEPEEFLNRNLAINNDATEENVFSFLMLNEDNVELVGYNDKPPTYYTVFDNSVVVFDSYDKLYESSLQNRNTICHAKRYQPFELVDTFVPDLDEAFNRFLYTMSAVNAFSTFKGYVPEVLTRNSAKLKRRIFNDRKKFPQDSDYTAHGRPRP